jgi:hypothetical protein
MSTSESRKYGSVETILVLCETCHWCATYFDKSRMPSDKCLICRNTVISIFPILPNEEFAFNYNEKRGVELEFGLRKSKDRSERKERQQITPSHLFFLQSECLRNVCQLRLLKEIPSHKLCT